MERISSPLAEFVKVLYTSQVLITVKAVPTKKASVQCVAKRSWIPKTTNRLLSRCSGELWLSMVVLSTLTFQGIMRMVRRTK